MKHYFNFVAVAVIALMFTACTNASNDQNAAGSDTSAVATEQTNAPAEPILTEEGLPPVVIGANVNDLPEAVEGLYASKKYHQIDPNLSDEEIAWDEVEGWYFYDADGNKLFAAETIEKGGKKIIYSILVYSPTIKTAQGAHVGMSRQELAAIDGAKYIEPNPEADYEIHIFELGKISITMDYENKIATDMRLLQESLLDF